MLWFSHNLAHIVNDTIPLNLAVSSKPDPFSMKKDTGEQETKTGLRLERLLAGIIP